MAELLLELLSEEIPARMQARAVEDLKRLVGEGLAKAGLTFKRLDAFVTPRRLALVVDGLPLRQADVAEERRGPRVDAPAQAIEGFLRSTGLTLAQCEKRTTDKGEFYFAVIEKKGRKTTDILPGLLGSVLTAFPWPKSMRWAGSSRWVRPVRGIVCLFDGKTVSVVFGDVKTGNATRGHRFLAPKPFKVKNFADYKKKLLKAKVMLDPAERRAVIERTAAKLAAAKGFVVVRDDGLLNEVAGLVEWPVALLGEIDKSFTYLWSDVITTVMRHHQKYFSLKDKSGKLAPFFVVIANIKDTGKVIVSGNERVLRARLADAKFFYEQDSSQPLENYVPRLKNLVFHARLGTMWDKVDRLEELADTIGAYLPTTNPKLVRRAARLCKADLVTQMVGEFPELQGKMGGRYAYYGQSREVEDNVVTTAISEHYSPAGPSDTCPTAPVSVAVALADKLDTLVGFFAIGEMPTGSKDPFALRRAALGIVRLILENGLRLPLSDIFGQAVHGYLRQDNKAVRAGIESRIPQGDALRQTLEVGFDAFMADDVLAFILDRIKVQLRERGLRHDLLDAAFAVGRPGGGREDDLVRLLARVDALKAFLATADGANLLVAYRRAANILRIEEKKDGKSYDASVDQVLLIMPEEKHLNTSLLAADSSTIRPALMSESYITAMNSLASLRAPVDTFFDKVTVNCDDPNLRANRLRLLSRIRSVLGGVADFAKIEG